MPKVDRYALRRAFRWDGWLDKETGEILECEKETTEDGMNKYVIPEKMLKDKVRYVRIPYLDYVQFALDIIDSGLLSQELLDLYGVHRIDYKNDSHLLFPQYDKLRGSEVSNEGNDVYGMIDEIAEDNEDIAELLSSWAKTTSWVYIERWANEMGCELV
ncbi:MAG: hypothetical protein RR893_12550 [Clostridia bacterium]